VTLHLWCCSYYYCYTSLSQFDDLDYWGNLCSSLGLHYNAGWTGLPQFHSGWCCQSFPPTPPVSTEHSFLPDLWGSTSYHQFSSWNIHWLPVHKDKCSRRRYWCQSASMMQPLVDQHVIWSLDNWPAQLSCQRTDDVELATCLTLVIWSDTKGAITSKIKHAIKHKTSPARLAQLLQPSLAFCLS